MLQLVKDVYEQRHALFSTCSYQRRHCAWNFVPHCSPNMSCRWATLHAHFCSSPELHRLTSITVWFGLNTDMLRAYLYTYVSRVSTAASRCTPAHLTPPAAPLGVGPNHSGARLSLEPRARVLGPAVARALAVSDASRSPRPLSPTPSASPTSAHGGQL